MFKSFVATTKSVSSLKSFRSTIAVSVANDSSLAFAAILMMMWDIPNVTILWVFAAYFLSSSVMLKLTSNMRPRYLFIALIFSMVSCVIFAKDNGQIFIPVMLTIMLTLVDLLKINLMHDLKVLSEETGESYTSIISVNNILFLFFMGISLPVFGFIGGYGSHALFLGLLVLVIYSYRLGRNVKASHVSDSSAYRVKLSHDAFIMSILSFFMSAVAFFSRRFILPILVIKVSSHLGMEDKSLHIFGIAMGFVALFTMLLRGRSGGAGAVKFMFKSYYFVLFGWLAIAAILMMSELNTFYIVMACFLILWVDYYARIWSITFVSQSGFIADSDNKISFNPSRLRGYMAIQTLYKSVGSSLGFVCAALLYDHVSISAILIGMCSVTILVGIVSNIIIARSRKALAVADLPDCC